MQIIRVNVQKPQPKIIEKWAKALRKGAVLLCPSETCYILAANIYNRQAIQKVFQIKGRNFDQPLGVIVASQEEAEKIVFLNSKAKILYQKFFPGKLTVISKKKKVVPDILTASRKTLGVSIPNSPFAAYLAKETHFPFTATSANKSGGKPPYSVPEALGQFSTKEKNLIDIVVDGGELPKILTTTVIDVTLKVPRLVRQGFVTQEAIEKAIGKVEIL